MTQISIDSAEYAGLMREINYLRFAAGILDREQFCEHDQLLRQDLKKRGIPDSEISETWDHDYYWWNQPPKKYGLPADWRKEFFSMLGIERESGTATSSIRMTREDVQIVDLLVEAGLFESRSGGVAYFLNHGLEWAKHWISKNLQRVKDLRAGQRQLAQLRTQMDAQGPSSGMWVMGVPIEIGRTYNDHEASLLRRGLQLAKERKDDETARVIEKVLDQAGQPLEGSVAEPQLDEEKKALVARLGETEICPACKSKRLVKDWAFFTIHCIECHKDFKLVPIEKKGVVQVEVRAQKQSNQES